jgi:hypothetical protein
VLARTKELRQKPAPPLGMGRGACDQAQRENGNKHPFHIQTRWTQ